jgi:hypothetical protein
MRTDAVPDRNEVYLSRIVLQEALTKRVTTLAILEVSRLTQPINGFSEPPRKESIMAKFYVESGPVQLTFDAPNAQAAAVKAFQWSCDKQAEIDAVSPLEHLIEAEENGWQLHETIHVNEKGFGRFDGVSFDTLEIVSIWQGEAFPWV